MLHLEPFINIRTRQAVGTSAKSEQVSAFGFYRQKRACFFHCYVTMKITKSYKVNEKNTYKEHLQLIEKKKKNNKKNKKKEIYIQTQGNHCTLYINHTNLCMAQRGLCVTKNNHHLNKKTNGLPLVGYIAVKGHNKYVCTCVYYLMDAFVFSNTINLFHLHTKACWQTSLHSIKDHIRDILQTPLACFRP